MAPTPEFNNDASFKLILMDRHNTKGNKIISRSKTLICENNFYKTSPLHIMSNNFKSAHQWKFWFRTQVLPSPVQCTQLHFSSALTSLKHHQSALFKSHSPKPAANRMKCAAFWVFVPPLWVKSDAVVEIQANLRAITIILGNHGKR